MTQGKCLVLFLITSNQNQNFMNSSHMLLSARCNCGVIQRRLNSTSFLWHFSALNKFLSFHIPALSYSMMAPASVPVSVHWFVAAAALGQFRGQSVSFRWAQQSVMNAVPSYQGSAAAEWQPNAPIDLISFIFRHEGCSSCCPALDPGWILLVIAYKHKCLIKPFFYYIIQSLDRIILIRDKNDFINNRVWWVTN